MAISLRPYQKEALDAILQNDAKGISKQLVVLPTGAGKTILFSQLPIIRPNTIPMLVLAHRAELLEQAKEKILASNPHLTVEIEQADRKAGHADVVVASVATLGRNNTPRILEYPKDYFKAIIIDEAHHAAAQSYRRVIDYFNSPYILGVTATPQRSDSTRLTDVFQEIVYYKSIQDLIEDGWLSPLVGYRVKTKTDITKVEIQHGEYNQSQLEDEINNPERNACIVASYNNLANATKAIVFAAGVDHAQSLFSAFAKNGTSVRIILGTTPPEERAQILSDFKSGEVMVLINVGVLTEGFDEPSLQTIIIAKPTRSTLLYTQIVGRGTRLFEGKPHCTIIDITDTTVGKKPMGLPTLLGLPADFDLQGQSLTEVAKKFEELENFCPGEAVRVLKPEDIDLAYTRINLFMPPPPNPVVQEYSKLVWAEIAENKFYLGINSFESMHIHCDALGRWVTELHSRSGQKIHVKELGKTMNIRESFARTDKWIQNNRSLAMKLLDASESWRADGPSDAQKRMLKRIGVPLTADLTKGMASQIISKYYDNNPEEAKRRTYFKNKNNNYK
ncbi:SSL2 DNA or RNA helicases of superfamily II [uncultured Caudovirales phage]|uniref:SSL2 DNA or RNA helicases of superfamily II n=1 Tax=uncultured Caudovirales phage TaxID=2100421 RepID=A0A6J5MC52_9CAUD|nr:SSL2 DNA or RNA helicases of superfamily II [uncultured Caudovirales phage]CAB4162125.1 SSL2 DNA or RNA helicases of superfamily II [uncultured Caudovirales phage]